MGSGFSPQIPFTLFVHPPKLVIAYQTFFTKINTMYKCLKESE